MEQYLRQLYYDLNSPVAYTSVQNLWNKIKSDGKQKEISHEKLRNWIDEQYTYTLHKQYKKPPIYRKTMVKTVDDQWQADLVEMREFSKINNGYNYLLTVIDCFSKYAWTEPLKTKTGVETASAFQMIFKEGRKPLKIQFDEGKEFYNKNVKELFENNGITFFNTYSDKKASIVERYNKTLKTRMFKYFTKEETRIWVDVLGSFVKAYNNTYHSTIKMTPVEASLEENSEIVWWNIYGAYITADYGVPAFKLGQTVRISKYKSIFTKGYMPNFSEEYFKIKQILIGNPIVYKLEDLKEEGLNGIFYENELSAYNPTDDVEYKIEKVIGKKLIKGEKYILVKYKGWPDKFNEWLPATNLVSK